MKKLWFFAIIYFAVYLASNYSPSVNALSNDYTSFAEINITTGRLLENYTDKDYSTYYKKVSKRKIFGWRTYIVNDNVSATFISETLYSYYNNASSSITYTLTTVGETIQKTSISATGSISYSLSNTTNVKKFKNGLDASLKMEATYNETISYKETEKTEITIEAGTTCLVYMTGNAKVKNGVAAKYVWWHRQIRGGFEYFTITDLYPRIEKRKLW